MSDRNHNPQSKLIEDERVVQCAVKAHLDAQVETLDFTVTSKLAAARHTALSALDEKPAWYKLPGWRTVAISTAALAMVYVISSQLLLTSAVQQRNPQIANLNTGELMEELTILAEGDDIEFYQNIEFLEWLEHNG